MERFLYQIKPRFLWIWVVTNEHGGVIYSGSKESCKALAGLLNLMWDNGYANGRYDEFTCRPYSPNAAIPCATAQEKLMLALKNEDYEEAARLRDLINKK